MTVTMVSRPLLAWLSHAKNLLLRNRPSHTSTRRPLVRHAEFRSCASFPVTDDPGIKQIERLGLTKVSLAPSSRDLPENFERPDQSSSRPEQIDVDVGARTTTDSSLASVASGKRFRRRGAGYFAHQWCRLAIGCGPSQPGKRGRRSVASGLDQLHHPPEAPRSCRTL